MNNQQQNQDYNFIFAHRPNSGISVGAKNIDGTLYISYAFTNDGTSRSGKYNPKRRDFFSRKRSREIITGRILTHSLGNAISNTMSFPSDIPAHMFMRSFRKQFHSGVFNRDDQTITSMLNLLKEMIKQNMLLATQEDKAPKEKAQTA